MNNSTTVINRVPKKQLDKERASSGSISSRRARKLVSVASSLLVLVAAVAPLQSADAALACENTFQCEEAFHRGSECINGFCTNPFQKGGCLKTLRPGWKGTRVCNSEDPPYAAEMGYCKEPDEDLKYMEIRIHSQNWESVFFESWVLQIMLSEMLNVPVTIETGTPDAKLNFYDAQSPLGYGTSNDWKSLKVASQFGDCRNVPQKDGVYRPCAHVIPEVWNGQLDRVRELKERGYVEPPLGLGALGHQSWFIPRFTAERDPTILSFLGLQGEQHRQKLADMFRRPTTWGYYCDNISKSNCTADDSATRAPVGEIERKKMFLENVYTGHFRETEKNNCKLHPTNCTGHIANYPCGWSSYVQPQTHHLNIALSSDGEQPGSQGYEYSQLLEIWAAANATKSDVVMHWWTPEALVRTYANTDAEFLRVALPPPSQECIESRIAVVDRCSNESLVRVGKPEGACDEAPHPLQKVISTGLLASINDPSIPEAKRSPVYDTIALFQVTSYQVGRFYDYWLERGTDKYNFDPRDATCQWVIENFDYLQTFIPRSHPRVLQEESRNGLLFYTSILVASLSILMSLAASFTTFRFRKCRSLRYAQIEFLSLLLIGLLLVSIGSVLAVIVPTDASCIAVTWLINLGYTLELVPLIVKVAALNRLMSAARQARRVEVKRTALFGAVLFLSTIIVIFLSLWTGLDPPSRETDYKLTDIQTADGESIISINQFCGSKSDTWRYVAVAWNTLYLIIASVLAFQTRTMQKDFNESQTLAIMIYSHFIFVVLRVSTFFLEDSLLESELVMIHALLYSCDALATLCIYFLPKFVKVHSELTNPNMFRSRNPDVASLDDAATGLMGTRSFRVAEFDTARSYNTDYGGRSDRGSAHAIRTNVLQEAPHQRCKHCGKAPYELIGHAHDNDDDSSFSNSGNMSTETSNESPQSVESAILNTQREARLESIFSSQQPPPQSADLEEDSEYFT